MDDAKIKPRLLWRYVVFATIGLVLIFLAIYVFTHGVLSVKSSSGTSVEIQDMAGKKIAVSESSYQSVLGTGRYIVIATKAQAVSRKLVNVTPLHITESSLTPVTPTSPEPVTNLSSFKPTKTPNGLVFINQDSQRLVNIGNTLSVISPETIVNDISWLDNSRALIVTQNTNLSSSLSLYEKGGLKQISLPGGASTAKSLYIASSRSSVYILIDTALYRSNISSIAFKKVTDLPKNSQLITASDESVLSGVYDHEDLLVTIVSSSSGKKIATKDYKTPASQSYVFSAAFSGDGSRLIVINDGRGGVYSSKLELQKSFPDTNVSAGVWLDDKTVVYSSANTLWRYTPNEDLAESLATMPPYALIYGMNIPADKSLIYLNTSSSNFSSLYQIMLGRGSQISNRPARVLGESNMRDLGNSCTIFYVNYESLYIVASAPEGFQDSCKQQIYDYLNSMELSSLPIQFITGQASVIGGGD